METRKVQIAGGSTYTISIPKHWANEHGISDGTVFELYTDEDTLVATPQERDGSTGGEIDIGTRTGEPLLRSIVSMYINGFDTLDIETPGLSTDQRREVRDAAARLSGLQVIEEEADRIRLQYLLDREAVSAVDVVEQMHIIARSMLSDAVQALADGDEQLAAEVQDRDDELDRMYALLLRTFRSSLREPRANGRASVDRMTYFDYQTCARQLERIGDHAVKIAGLVEELDEVPDPVAEALGAMHELSARAIEDAVGALLADDSGEVERIANEVLGEIPEAEARARSINRELREYSAEQAQPLGIAVDSLSRTAEYGGNIAESALQRAAPSP